MLEVDQLSESTLLFFVLHLFSVFGIFLFSIRLVKWWLWPVINQLDQSRGVSSGLFIASIAWLIGLAISRQCGSRLHALYLSAAHSHALRERNRKFIIGSVFQAQKHV